jgi:hypothetical protein
MHKLHQPEYLDPMQQPYAIFTFKYRSQAAVEKIVKKKIDTSNVQQAVQEIEEERLMRLPKDELVAELMRRQMSSAASPAAAVIVGVEALSHASQLRGDWEKKPASKAATAAAAAAASNNGWGEEIKPSDSVSIVAASTASKKADDWQQLGQGEVAAGAGRNKKEGSRASKAETKDHWITNDPELKKASGGGDGGGGGVVDW